MPNPFKPCRECGYPTNREDGLCFDHSGEQDYEPKDYRRMSCGTEKKELIERQREVFDRGYFG